MDIKRQSGILLHPTSFPGNYGIGDFGVQAYEFIKFLKKANQNLWQVLPLTTTSFGDSPYQSFSTFAGNTLLISPDELLTQGYLTSFKQPPVFDEESIDYGAVIEYKTALYNEAFENFKNSATNAQKKDFDTFTKNNSFWLEDYTLFISIKEYFINKRRNEGFTDEYNEFYNKSKNFMEKSLIDDYYFGGTWVTWPKDILEKSESAVNKYKNLLAHKIEYHTFLQYEFFRQWNNLKAYTSKKGISIIGDIPIFIAFDSADCWANKNLFYLSDSGFPTDVAGVPPDYFSETGQLWGNPLYNWDEMEKDGYKWWISRIKAAAEMYDFIRIDHFRGFDTYWAVPFGEKTAQNGQWHTGPRIKLFNEISKTLGDVPLIAEDLGDMFDSVYELRDECNLPGMKVLQFAFSDTAKNAFLPHNFTNPNCVVYTGTHDNDTTVGWFSELPEGEKDYVRKYLNTDGADIAWSLIRLAYASVAAFAITPLQDCLSLPGKYRMNLPGVAEGNWKWRYKKEMLTDSIADGLKYFSEIFGRNEQIKE